MSNAEAFDATFRTLKDVLEPFRSELDVRADAPDHFALYFPPGGGRPAGEFFGAAQIKKQYVSFHLMPVYCHPELLDDLSPALRKRMQGKSCFNFKKIGDEEVRELAALAERGYRRMRDGGV